MMTLRTQTIVVTPLDEKIINQDKKLKIGAYKRGLSWSKLNPQNTGCLMELFLGCSKVQNGFEFYSYTPPLKKLINPGKTLRRFTHIHNVSGRKTSV